MDLNQILPDLVAVMYQEGPGLSFEEKQKITNYRDIICSNYPTTSIKNYTFTSFCTLQGKVHRIIEDLADTFCTKPKREVAEGDDLSFLMSMNDEEYSQYRPNPPQTNYCTVQGLASKGKNIKKIDVYLITSPQQQDEIETVENVRSWLLESTTTPNIPGVQVNYYFSAN
ncbi:MAG: hypothetical protein CMO81_02945 [Waddliaceae bacterium]|nr:hypothetical protein [Waddliaceae bacterium]